jgi:hypothetical protein
MFRKLALAGTISLVLAGLAWAANAPTYQDPVGQTRDAQGVVLIDTTGAPYKAASSGGGAVTEADGANVTLGAKADAKSTATDTTAVTLMSVAKQISASVQAAAASLSAAQPAGTNIIGKVGIDQTTDGTTNGVRIVGSSKPTYTAAGTGYTAYTTPTDMVCLQGSASKTVRVLHLVSRIQSTSAALQTIYFIKRSAADTGGTETTPAAVSWDSTNAAATAVVHLYSAAPTLGASLGNISIGTTASATLAGSPTQTSVYSVIASGSLVDFKQQILLRGTTEELCMNYNGAALTSGFTMTWDAIWAEE